MRTAREYTRTVSRPFLLSGVDSATADPYVLATYGRLAAAVRAVEALADDVGAHVARVDAAGTDLTWDERGELAVHTSALKVVATDDRAGRDLEDLRGHRSEGHQQRGGPRPLLAQRPHPHAARPVAYKQRELGEHFLNGTYPPFTVYS